MEVGALLTVGDLIIAHLQQIVNSFGKQLFDENAMCVHVWCVWVCYSIVSRILTYCRDFWVYGKLAQESLTSPFKKETRMISEIHDK